MKTTINFDVNGNGFNGSCNLSTEYSVEELIQILAARSKDLSMVIDFVRSGDLTKLVRDIADIAVQTEQRMDEVRERSLNKWEQELKNKELTETE